MQNDETPVSGDPYIRPASAIDWEAMRAAEAARIAGMRDEMIRRFGEVSAFLTVLTEDDILADEATDD